MTNHHDLDFATLIRKKGYRLTPQRQIILDAVCAVGGHASPNHVYEEVQRTSAAINQATVYRTLDFLCKVGVVNSTVALDGHTVYEIAAPESHHHLTCRVCGGDQEVPQELVIPLLKTIKAQYDFAVDSATHLSLFGLCARCRAAAGQASEA